MSDQYKTPEANIDDLLDELSFLPPRSLRERITHVKVGLKWHAIAPENRKLTRFENDEFFGQVCIVFTSEPGPEYVVPVRKVSALRVIPQD